MKYLAIFCSAQFQDPQGGPCHLIVRGEAGLKKTYTRFSGCSVPDVT